MVVVVVVVVVVVAVVVVVVVAVVVAVVVVVAEIPVDEAEQFTSGESRSMTSSFIKLTNMICCIEYSYLFFPFYLKPS